MNEGTSNRLGWLLILLVPQLILNWAGWFIGWPLWLNSAAALVMVLIPPLGGPIGTIYFIGIVWHVIALVINHAQS
jgi:hypothetical protein